MRTVVGYLLRKAAPSNAAIGHVATFNDLHVTEAMMMIETLVYRIRRIFFNDSDLEIRRGLRQVVRSA